MKTPSPSPCWLGNPARRSRKWWPNLSTFAKLAILTYVVLKEPGWMEQYCKQRIEPAVHRTAVRVVDRVVR